MSKKKKITLDKATDFLLFRSVCEKFRILFNYWSKPGGGYIAEADEDALAEIGY